MATKLAFFFLFAFVCVQLSSAGLVRPVRDTPSASDAGKVIDDAVENLKSGFEDLFKNIQDNDLVRDFSENVQKLTETIHSEGKDLVNKIQASATN